MWGWGGGLHIRCTGPKITLIRPWPQGVIVKAASQAGVLVLCSLHGFGNRFLQIHQKHAIAFPSALTLLCQRLQLCQGLFCLATGITGDSGNNVIYSTLPLKNRPDIQEKVFLVCYMNQFCLIHFDRDSGTQIDVVL